MFTLPIPNDVQGSVFNIMLTPIHMQLKLDQLHQLHIKYVHDLCCTIIIFEKPINIITIVNITIIIEL